MDLEAIQSMADAVAMHTNDSTAERLALQVHVLLAEVTRLTEELAAPGVRSVPVSALEAVEAERDSLRTALQVVAGWLPVSEADARGLTEFAERALAGSESR